jgi:polyferredoxin
MSSPDSIGSIPVTVEPPKVSRKLHWQRRGLQIATILIAFLIPLSGLFRIDPIAGAFVILDRQVWWADFFLIFGLWLIIASSLVMMYSLVGTAFCGWVCPQNTLAEWANMLTRKLLGKRAEVSLDGEKMQVASQKNKWGNWFVLGILIFIVSLFMALIPVMYFYTPDVIWSFVTFRDDARLAPSLHYIYFIFVLIIFIDIAFIRHFWCRFMCIYKVWQHGFKTKQTLHIAYDASRADLCEKCNYCVTACFLDLDPRNTDVYDTCINCGECVTACRNLQAKKGRSGLLSFHIGERKAGKMALLKTRLSSLSTRVNWTIPFALLGLVMFVYGIASYEDYHLAVHRADVMHAEKIQDYRVAISNKRYQKASLKVSVDGLPEGSYTLSDTQVKFKEAGRIDLNLHINDELPPGLYPVLVRVESQDGWHKTYRVQHFVGRS